MQLPYSNLRVTHQNPGAEMPLILPILLTCNVSDELIHDNIRINSYAQHPWLNSSPAHGVPAVICGSGPSLVDNLDKIAELKAAGADVFALNGAAKFLFDHDIMPKYQVLIDAREQTADLVGPALAHLFASQCHPACFWKVPNAVLYHLQIEDIDAYLPTEQPEHVMIGGAASVGNTTPCLAYAMGYRELHLFGYDSSNRGDSTHAFRQPMNDGDPMASVTFDGTEYICSLTMKLQAERFCSRTAPALKSLGVKINVYGDGLLPAMYRAPKLIFSEAEKYRMMWSKPEYRIQAPGETMVDTFLERVKPTGKIIDFGCGTGRAGLRLAEAGHDVLLIDFADNCRDSDALHLPFLVHDLTLPIPARARFGFCTDMLEHIPPDDVSSVVSNIMEAAKCVFFQISTVPDNLGTLIGADLHLTVKPTEWWLALFRERGYHVSWWEQSPGEARFIVHSPDRS